MLQVYVAVTADNPGIIIISTSPFSGSGNWGHEISASERREGERRIWDGRGGEGRRKRRKEGRKEE